MYNALDLMTSPAITVAPDATLEEACGLLLKHEISGMPVVNAGGQLLGMFSELDEARQLKNAMFVCCGLPIVDDEGHTVGHLSEADELSDLVADFASHPVSDYMTTKVATATSDHSIAEIIDLFVLRGVHRLPVIDGHRVIGVIGLRDLVRFVRRIKKELLNSTVSVAAR